MKFASTVHEIDKFGNAENDLMYRSGIKIKYDKTKNYNKYIMRFINYLISLPSKKVSFDSGNTVKEDSLSDRFYSEM